MTEEESGIYKIISPSGRIYVGQSHNLYKRYKAYFKYKAKGQTKLYNSFKKYGVINHVFNTIEKCSILDLNIRERYWQEYYDCVENGLNCVLIKADSPSGGLCLETRNKISARLKGRIFSKEHKKIFLIQ